MDGWTDIFTTRALMKVKKKNKKYASFGHPGDHG